MYIFTVFIFGLVIGSFLNLCICRIPQNESVIFPHSFCPHCGKRLKPIDLIPVFSFIFLRGRCRCCGTNISFQYPLVEIITAILFFATIYKFGFIPASLVYLVIIGILIVITFIDLKLHIIPNRVIIFGLALGIIINIISPLTSFLGGVIGFFSAGSFFLALAILSRGSMGGGDIKLAAIIGLYLGVKKAMLGLFLAFLIGAIIGILLIIIGRKTRKDFIPFGPFIAVGTVLSIFVGDELIRLYLTHLF